MPDVGGFQGCCGAGILWGIVNTPQKKLIDVFVARAKTSHWGIILFIDNSQVQLLSAYDGTKYVQDKEVSNGGKRWAAAIREQGYRVDEHFLGGNPNHNELAPHILTLYIWYLNGEGKNKESVYVGKQEERAKDVPPSEPGVPTGKGVAERLRRKRVPRLFGDIEF